MNKTVINNTGDFQCHIIYDKTYLRIIKWIIDIYKNNIFEEDDFKIDINKKICHYNYTCIDECCCFNHIYNFKTREFIVRKITNMNPDFIEDIDENDTNEKINKKYQLSISM